ncbi:MAG: YceI family protein [Chloroherpetonaceae bacterium]
MKNYLFRSLFIALILAFSSNYLFAQKEKVENVDIKQSDFSFSLQTDQGVIEGKFKLKSGELLFQDTILKNFKFVIDMKSLQITQTDSALTEAQIREVLCSPGFFNCDSFPEATIVSNRIDHKLNQDYFNIANLIIKNKTNEVRFVITLRNIKDSQTFYTTMSFDRIKSNLRYIQQPNSIGIKDSYFFETILFSLNIVTAKK